MVDISVINQENKILIAGPCVVEDYQTCYTIAKELQRVCKFYNFVPVFKASWDKANRTSITSFRGIGQIEALNIINQIKKDLNILTITDVHETSQVEEVSKFVDLLQIPAFLSRQTDLIESCAKTGKPTLVKKGQFLSHEVCKFIEKKYYELGGNTMIICERGNSFGYNDLVVDVTSISKLREFCRKSLVALDCTHSLQKPNQTNGLTSGNSKYIEDMVKYAAVMNCRVLFIECHPEPKNSPSDSENMLNLIELENVIKTANKIFQINE